MSDISFISLLNATLEFLTTTYTAPAWLFLLLFIASIPQFLKIYRWLRKSKKTEQIANKITIPAKNISSSITDNKFTEGVLNTVQKLKSLPDEAFTESMVSTVNKIKNVAHSAGEAASDGIAAAARKFEAEMNSQKTNVADSALNSGEQDEERLKMIILKQLFKVGDNGRLPQSIASDLSMGSIVTNGYLDELTETRLIAKRKTSLGETYFITKMGKAFCEQQGFER